MYRFVIRFTTTKYHIKVIFVFGIHGHNCFRFSLYILLGWNTARHIQQCNHEFVSCIYCGNKECTYFNMRNMLCDVEAKQRIYASINEAIILNNSTGLLFWILENNLGDIWNSVHENEFKHVVCWMAAIMIGLNVLTERKIVTHGSAGYRLTRLHWDIWQWTKPRLVKCLALSDYQLNLHLSTCPRAIFQWMRTKHDRKWLETGIPAGDRANQDQI